MGNYGTKLTRDGYDVADATDQQIAFSSKFNYLKLVGTGTANVEKSSAAGWGGTGIAHGQSFIPIVFCYIRCTDEGASDETVMLSQRGTDAEGYSPQIYYEIRSDNIFIWIPSNGITTTHWTVRYYIFYNRLE